MRIDRLHLRAYGPFRDCSLDFRDGEAGVHVVYGDNEAGKSSALRGLRAALFGIPKTTNDAFGMDRKEMRVGAELREGQEIISYLWRRRDKQPLWDDNDENALPDDALAPFLKGLTPDHFRDFFGMHHTDLIRGGRLLTLGDTDLGTALFAAAGGLRHLTNLLNDLEREAGEYFRERGQKQRINAALRAYRDARKREKDESLSSDAWEARFKNLAKHRAERETCAAELSACERALARVSRYMRATVPAARRARLVEALKPLTDCPRLPSDMRENFRAAMSKKSQAEAAIEEVTRDRKRLEAAIAELAVDAPLLACADEIDALREEALRLTALQDRCREEVEPHAQRCEGELRGLLQTLMPTAMPEQASHLAVPEALREHINTLALRRTGLEEERRNRQEALDATRQAVARAEAALKEESADVTLPQLEALLEAAQAEGDWDARTRDFRTERAGLEDQITTELARLPYWRGDAAALSQAPMPGRSTLTDWRTRWLAAQERLRDAERDLDAAGSTHRGLLERFTTFKADKDLPHEDALRDLRESRDARWRQLRSRWMAGESFPEQPEPPESTPLPDAFERDTREADHMADEMRRQAGLLAEYAQLQQQCDAASRQRDAADTACAEAREAFTALEEAWRALWQDRGLDTPGTPDEMLEWDQARTRLVESFTHCADLRIREAEAQRAGDALRVRLVQALSGREEPPTAAATLAEALTRLDRLVRSERDRAERIRHHEAELRRLRGESLPDAERKAAASEEAWKTWETDWSAAMQELDLSGETPPHQANTIVAQRNRAADLAEDYRQSRETIEQLRHATASLHARIASVVHAAHYEQTGPTPEDTLRLLVQSLTQSRENAARRTALLDQQADMESRYERGREQAREAETTLALYCTEAGGVSLEKLPERIEESAERDRLVSELETAEEQLLLEAGNTPLDVFLEEVVELAPDTLEGRKREHEARRQELTARLRELDTTIGGLETELKALDGSAKAAEAREEAEALLATLGEDSATYVRLKLSEAILRRAVDRYREQEQGPLLERAGQYFARMTCGRFEGLASDFEDDRPVLAGRRAGGTLVSLSGMSDGTADQLYLALRLAALDLYFQTRARVPLVLDDLLINFDDARAAATLEILGELAQETQVILFTHHRHLCDLATEHIPAKQLFVQALQAVNES